MPGKISPVQIFSAFILFYFFVACLNFGRRGGGGLEAGNGKPYYEVEEVDINTAVVNIFGGDKDWLCETRERCEQSFGAGTAGGCVGRAPGAGPGTDGETAAATVAIAPPHGVGYLRILLTHGLQ